MNRHKIWIWAALASLICTVSASQNPGTSSISGTMRDSHDEHPVSGVLVRLAPDPVDPITRSLVNVEDLPNAGVRIEVTTDYRGAYAFNRIPNGNYRMEIEPPTKYMVTHDYQYKNVSVGTGQSTTVDWPLDPAVLISGLVKRSTGRPSANTPVKIEVVNSYSDSETITDAAGVFRATVPAQCAIAVEVSHQGETSDRVQQFQIRGAPRDPIVVMLQPGTIVSGYVVDGKNQPISNARVEFRPGGLAKVGADGWFEIADLLPGQHKIVVSPPEDVGGREQIVMDLDVASGERLADLPLVYNPEVDLAIAGRVTDLEGKPLAGAQMSWGSPEHGWAPLTITQDDGTYVVRDLLPGTYHLVYLEYGGEQYGHDKTVRGLRRAASGSKDVDFQVEVKLARPTPERFEIHVVSARDESPVTSFDVLYQEGVDQIFNTEKCNIIGLLHGPPRGKVTDSRGVFVTGKRPGLQYSLAIRAAGFGLWLSVVDIAEPTMTIALEPESWVRGHAVDTAGQPVANAIVMYHSLYGYRTPEPDWMAVLGKTDAYGYFDIGGLPSSEVPLMFMHPDYASVRITAVPVRGGGADTDVVLRPAGVLRGTIYLDGKPFGGQAFVDYFDRETNPGFGIGGNVVQQDGSYRIGRLDAGDGTVTATIYPWVESKKQVQKVTAIIAEGATVPVDFRFVSNK